MWHIVVHKRLIECSVYLQKCAETHRLCELVGLMCRIKFHDGMIFVL